MEPFVMLVVSFIIGEVLDKNSYILMVCLLIAVLLLIFDGVAGIKARKMRNIG